MKPADHVGRQAERCVVSRQPPLNDAETIATPQGIGLIDIGARCLNEGSHDDARRSRELISLGCLVSRLLIRTASCASLTCRN